MSFHRAILVLMLWLTTCISSTHAQALQWVRQFGESRSDSARAVTTDGLGNVYVAGHIGKFVNVNEPDQTDAFLSKYDLSGTLLWSRQFGTPASDSALGISADKLGNVFITGNTFGSLGQLNAGYYDAYASKYDASGNLQWTRQFGTTSQDEGSSVSADGLGNVYVTGYTGGDLVGTSAGFADVFFRKYDTMGNLLWSKQIGTSQVDYSHGVSFDGLGNVYISGTTGGNLGAPNAGYSDAFVRKYDASGALLWSRQVGTADYENSTRVTADRLGNVYVSGSTYQSLGGPLVGLEDAYLLKYDSSGALLWTRQFGTPHQTDSFDISADGLGNFYVTGMTDGNLEGPNAGQFDVYVRKYDASGTVVWTRQLGTPFSDQSYGVTTDGSGNVFIAGYTAGNFGTQNPGFGDAFIAKFYDGAVPEPKTAVVAGLAIVAVSVMCRKRLLPYSFPNAFSQGHS